MVVRMQQNEIFLLRDQYFCWEIRKITIFVSIPLFYGHGSKSYQSLTLCLLVSSAEYLCKQFDTRSGPKSDCIPERKFNEKNVF